MHRTLPLLAALLAPLTAQEPPRKPTKPADPPAAGASEDLDELLDELDSELSPGAGAKAQADGPRVSTFRGFVSTRLRSYLRERDQGRRDEQWLNELELELGIELTSSLSAYFRPRFLIDGADDDLWRSDPLEAHLTLRGKSGDLRLGQMVENWGIADTYNPVDLLNRRDLGYDLLELRRLGEIGLRARQWFSGNATIGEPTLSLYFIPVFQEAEFPTRRNRFSLHSAAQPFNEARAQVPHGEDRMFYAARLNNTLSLDSLGADTQLVVAHGPDRSPLVVVQGGEAFPVYINTTAVGGGIRAVPNAAGWAEYTLKAELLYKHHHRSGPLPGSLPEDYLSYAFGFDRMFPNIFSDRDQLTLTLEFVGETGDARQTGRLRFFDDELVLRGLWEANDLQRSKLELRAIGSLEDGPYFGELVYNQQLRALHDDLQLELSLQVFDPGRSPQGLFQALPNNSSFTLGLRWDF